MEIRRNKYGELEMVFEEEDFRGEELLPQRADINEERTREGKYTKTYGLGGQKTELEEKLERDMKRVGWSEPHTEERIPHKVCPVCGTHFIGRPNQKYCSKRCRDVASRRAFRARERAKRGFKPHRGSVGEIYILTKWRDGTYRETFIPADYTKTEEEAIAYIERTFSDSRKSDIEDYKAQVRELFKRERGEQ